MMTIEEMIEKIQNIDGETQRVSYKTVIGNTVVGGNSEIVVQSMTDSDTANVSESVAQTKALYNAGSKIVRLAVHNDEAAKAIPYIRDALLAEGLDVPLVGCFHYNGHILLKKYPECAKALAKYRINPGNVGFGMNRDEKFAEIIDIAIKVNEECKKNNQPLKALRIGVNWGSLDKYMLEHVMNQNAKREIPLSSDDVLCDAMVLSAIQSANFAVHAGFPAEQIVISCKSSKTITTLNAYRKLSRFPFPLHFGVTEAGTGMYGRIKTAAALALAIDKGYCDTIRASITPAPGEPRIGEVELCYQVLQAMEIKHYLPSVTSCPGCGRTSSHNFKSLAQDIEEHIKTKMQAWKNTHQKVEEMNVAVMGCVVNGPGESKHAHIGISLPGNGEQPLAPVYADSKRICILRGSDVNDLSSMFKEIIDIYVDYKYGNKGISFKAFEEKSLAIAEKHDNKVIG